MTKKDYSKGKIYVIKNHGNNKVYVGSTIDYLSNRMAKHRYSSKVSTSPFYKAMNELGVENFYIQLVENYPCNSVDELVSREKHFIKEFNSYNEGYNFVIPSRDRKEYYQDNKEEIKAKVKNHYQENKEAINDKRKDYFKKYREENKVEIKERNRKCHEKKKEHYNQKSKEYWAENKDRLNQIKKEYYQQNKQLLREKYVQLYTCECGVEIQKGYKSTHLKSKIHLDYLEKINKK